MVAAPATVRRIRVTEAVGELAPLLLRHWLEVEGHLSPCPPNPCWAAYAQLEQAGQLVAFGAFVGDDLVGYASVFILPHLHYGWLSATHDALFVLQEHRRSGLDRQLISAVQDAARAAGARFILWHCKPGSALEQIMGRTGAVEEIVYRRDLVS